MPTLEDKFGMRRPTQPAPASAPPARASSAGPLQLERTRPSEAPASVLQLQRESPGDIAARRLEPKLMEAFNRPFLDYRAEPEVRARMENLLERERQRPEQELLQDKSIAREYNRTTRELAIGAGQQGPVNQTPARPQTPGVSDTERMTQQDYDALSPRQRAAVDFNGMLVRAVKKDLRNQENYQTNLTDTQRATYDKTVDRMFGKDRGSDVFAPETLKVLDQIKFNDTTADLDDFLGLNAAITEEDIAKIGSDQLDYTRMGQLAQKDSEATNRGHLVSGLADLTQKLRDNLPKSGSLDRAFQAAAAVDRNRDLELVGGLANPIKPRAMYGEGEGTFNPETGAAQDLPAFFQRSFSMLTDENSGHNPKDILKEVQNVLTPEELLQFAQYAQERGASTFADRVKIETTPKTPEEWLALIGKGKQ